MTYYWDTTAIAALVMEEAASSDIAGLVGTRGAMSSIGVVELRRATARVNAQAQQRCEMVLQRFAVVDIDAAMLLTASMITPTELRTLDAIHLACALAIDVDAIVTLDRRLADAARDHAVPVLP